MQNSGRKVFVVDDEPIIASTLATILRMSGFTATYFTNPNDALASALSEPPDLLLSDVIMPGMSGIDLALQIKSLCPSCKVMLFSGQAQSVDFVKDAQRVDENFHILPKPLLPGELLVAIAAKLAGN
jgi:DNA-binding NtrC family response regulator